MARVVKIPKNYKIGKNREITVYPNKSIYYRKYGKTFGGEGSEMTSTRIRPPKKTKKTKKSTSKGAGGRIKRFVGCLQSNPFTRGRMR